MRLRVRSRQGTYYVCVRIMILATGGMHEWFPFSFRLRANVAALHRNNVLRGPDALTGEPFFFLQMYAKNVSRNCFVDVVYTYLGAKRVVNGRWGMCSLRKVKLYRLVAEKISDTEENLGAFLSRKWCRINESPFSLNELIDKLVNRHGCFKTEY